MEKEIASQYRAALVMLVNAIDHCPPILWNNAEQPVPFWQVAYHALYFTDLYLSKDDLHFKLFFEQYPDHHKLGRLSNERIQKEGLLSVVDLKKYADWISSSLELRIDPESWSQSSGFEWLVMNKFELHLYNIRHLQHHAGELVERLHQVGITGIRWISAVN
jgi:hypothetical protein